MYELPFGCHAHDPVDFIRFDEREFLFSFAGSVQYRVAKVIMPSPKELARSRMFEAIEELSANNPKLPIYLKRTACYKDSIQQANT